MLGYGLDPLYGEASGGLGARTLSIRKLPFEKMCGGYASHFGVDPRWFDEAEAPAQGRAFHERVVRPLFFAERTPGQVNPFYLYVNVTTPEVLRRLRGLGMNLVLFDHAPACPAADAVTVDNAHAVAALLARLCDRGARAPCFIGWDRTGLTSNLEREAAFVAQAGAGRVVRLPWRAEAEVEADLSAALARLPAGSDGLLCGNGGIGIAAQRLVRAEGRALPVVCVDDLPGAESLALDAYAQPMAGLARLAWKRLVAQGREPATWSARTLRLRGELLVRSGGAAAEPGR